MAAAEDLTPTVGTLRACQALELPRSTVYRHRRRRRQGAESSLPRPRPRPARSLEPAEQQRVLDVFHSEPFIDAAPRQAYAHLLDQGIYLCSVRSMYRILHANAEVRERRNQLTHPKYVRPELLATAPNQVWSWDITKLLGPAKWTYYYLYVLLDLFSRFVVGWLLAPEESSVLAKQLITESIDKMGVPAGQLTVHADRGAPMTSHLVAHLLADLRVTKTHSRPHVSNDNPYSESQFKTMKYRPGFPDRFGSPEDARVFCRSFFAWYNHEHHHTGLALLTPADVHFGLATERLAARGNVLTNAYYAHPERFVRRPPRPGELPEAVWINKPEPAQPFDQAAK